MGKLVLGDGARRANGNETAGHPTPDPFQEWDARRVVSATLIVLAIAAGFLLLFRFYMVVFLFLVAVMLGIATKPVVSSLQKRGVRSELGVILVYLVLLAFIVLFLVLVVPLLAEQISAMADTVPKQYQNLRQGLILADNRLVRRIALGLPPTISFSIASLSAPSEGQGESANGLAPALSMIGGASYGLFILIAILVLAFFWVQEGEVLLRRALLLLPADRREPARAFYGELEGKVGAYFRGQIILCAVVGVMSLIGYVAIGLPYAVGLALIMAVCEAIPMIGPTLGAIPALLVALTVAPDKVLWTVLVVFIVQTSENNLLVPRVMDRSVGVNPIITILGITAFGFLFGFMGALMAVPLAAMVQIAAQRAMFRDSVPVEVGRSRASILRLETQELIRDVRRASREGPQEGINVDPEVERAEDLLEAIAVDLDRVLTEAEGEA